MLISSVSFLLPAEIAREGQITQLPVRKVVLYKNGVGYFEHEGRVTNNEAVSIDFTSSQLNDVLQSLTALDLGGGRITGVNYNSTSPLEQQLRNIPLGLGDDPSTADVFAALRGARVEVSGSGGIVSGRLLNLEITSEQKDNNTTVEHRRLAVVSDLGAVRTIELAPSVSVRVLDSKLQREMDRYLDLLASTRNQQMRHLTLEAQGTGARDIRVSYISEVPVWKSTYRIVFPKASQAGETATVHPAGVGSRRQHGRLGLGQRTALARGGSTAELCPVAITAVLHAPSGDWSARVGHVDAADT